ncbi:MAG: ABC transporter permease [Acidimicrobiia bacterium]
MNGSLARYALRRLLFLPVALVVVVTLAFALVNVIPGNPAGLVAGPVATDEQIAQVERDLGLDRSLWSRYADFLGDLSRGDLGRSYFTDRDVGAEIGRLLPKTLELVAVSLVVALGLGVGLGVVASYWAGRAGGRAAQVVISVSQAMPDFLIGLVLVYVLFFVLGWAPAPVGQLSFGESAPPHVTGSTLVDAVLAGRWDTFGSAVRHMVLPVATLGFYYASYFARVTVGGLVPALGSESVEFARASGLRERTVVWYAFRQALLPIVTYGGILLAALVGGAAIVETVFSWNGFGQWAIDATLQLDLPAIQGFVVVVGAGTLVVYLLLDVLLYALDPRIRRD